MEQQWKWVRADILVRKWDIEVMWKTDSPNPDLMILAASSWNQREADLIAVRTLYDFWK